ncbi:MAG: T9SS type A sorting domain-containing protein, partial [Bacteroidota bacterium]|nr:T9SS type A sorting domain-containing protein [Bacteroidota bacterium]
TKSADYVYAEMAGRIGQIKTYPNPVKDIVSLEFNNHKNQNVQFNLIDNNGTKIDEFITPNNKLDIDLSKYPSGVYYISFDSTNEEEGCITKEKQKTTTKIILSK